MTTVFDIISKEQLRLLKEAGFIVVHREPTYSMHRAGSRNQYMDCLSCSEIYHRMVGESIRLQNIDINKQESLL